jgi:hypothetical protein
MVGEMMSKIINLTGPFPSPAPDINNSLKNRLKTVAGGSIDDFTPKNYYTVGAPQLN